MHDPPGRPLEREVQVWWMVHHQTALPVQADVLSSDERSRAERFRRTLDRDRWIGARVFLRRVLGHKLGEPAAQIELMFDTNEKPLLVHHPELHFNLAHSADLVVVALTELGDVGIDVEQLRKDLDVTALARVAFGDGVAAQLSQVAVDDRADQFFRMWVRHEALVKALGAGFLEPLPPVLPPLWTSDLEVAPGYLGAVAVTPLDERDGERMRMTLVEGAGLLAG